MLGREHYFDPADKKAVIVINIEQMYNIVNNLFKGVDILILLVGLGTLLAAAIGVSNIMMVTVKERTVEIGIRRAIGATPGMIVYQIMAESVLLTIVAGMFGIVMAVMVLMGLESFVGPGFQVSFGTAMLSLGILVALGLLAGMAPTSRAMDIRPVDAMRDE
jgi:putative ABC transport system permease protein